MEHTSRWDPLVGLVVMEELIMAYKKKHIKKHIRKPKTWVDENGVTHLQIDTSDKRNEFHFNYQLRHRMQIIEDKRRKKPKHKKNYSDEY